jgi:RNA polymerase sigma factor (sigma-70 family)
MKHDYNKNLEKLIGDAIKCNSKAQEHLFKMYYSSMMNICYRYANDPHEAKDLFQDGFIKIFEHLGDYKFNGSLEGWMRRIMVNNAIDHIRRAKNKETVSLDSVAEYSDKKYDYNEAISKIASEELMALLQYVPNMSRAVFNLFVFEDYSHAEIAKTLNIKEGTSMWHLNNARNILKTEVQKLYKMEEPVYG